MHFLLTNDDAYDAAGLAALREAVGSLGRVTVAAPRHPQSGQGHAVTYAAPIRVETLDRPGLGRVHVCEGSPADCVRLALTTLAEDPVDWVLAGINRGANLGVDVLYSGTVAAAREAAIMGCRAAAFSQYVRRDVEQDWERSTRWTAGLLRQMIARNLAPGVIWNVNLPLPGVAAPRVQATSLARISLPMAFEVVDDAGPAGRSYRYCGRYADRRGEPGSDVAAVFDSAISVTPLGLDPTEPTLLETTFDAPPG